MDSQNWRAVLTIPQRVPSESSEGSTEPFRTRKGSTHRLVLTSDKRFWQSWHCFGVAHNVWHKTGRKNRNGENTRFLNFLSWKMAFEGAQRMCVGMIEVCFFVSVIPVRAPERQWSFSNLQFDKYCKNERAEVLFLLTKGMCYWTRRRGLKTWGQLAIRHRSRFRGKTKEVL